MNLQDRICLLVQLGEYTLSDDSQWQQVKKRASQENSWFIREFIELTMTNIGGSFLQKKILESWSENYKLPAINDKPETIGIVMAGNIPLVGFHDWLCVFISGHKSLIKLSSKDQVLFKHLTDKMIEWNKEMKELVQFADMLKGCGAYIATGSNNSSRYFEYYFGKYPHIIRRNRTSIAILTGKETTQDLEKLADDVYQYFGLGCRNVTKIYVPLGYDFLSLLTVFKKYNYLADHHKYKNNYDYNLAVLILNKKYYMTNDSILLVEDSPLFSPISQLNYEFYSNKKDLVALLQTMNNIQCIIGKDFISFGQAQEPGITDYADGLDTLLFLTNL